MTGMNQHLSHLDFDWYNVIGCRHEVECVC